MKKSPVQQEKEDQLAVVVADRLAQALEALPEGVRTSRGRTTDFALRYSISRSMAKRILGGVALPSAELMKRLADDLDVDMEWLMGETALDVDAHRLSRPMRIPEWDPVEGLTGRMSTMHRLHLPSDLTAASLVCVRLNSHVARPYVRPSDLLVVRTNAGLLHGAYHVVKWRSNRLEVLRLEAIASGDTVSVSAPSGNRHELAATQLSFGLAWPPEDSVARGEDAQALVIGHIVGRILFDSDGLVSLSFRDHSV